MGDLHSYEGRKERKTQGMMLFLMTTTRRAKIKMIESRILIGT